MSDSSGTRRLSDSPTTSRRTFVQGALGCLGLGMASSSAGQTATGDEGKSKSSAGPRSEPLHSLDGLGTRHVVESYRARRLEELGDRQLISAAAEIIGRPGEGLTSFTLHAPLELLARAGLLPLVAPEDREMARMQVVASAAAYGSGVSFLPTPPKSPTFNDLDSAATYLGGALKEGDPDRLEAAVVTIGRQFGLSNLVHTLTPQLLPTLTAASHSHIGLWLLLRHGGAESARDAGLLRQAARHLGRDPEGRLGSFDGLRITGGGRLEASPAEVEALIQERLSNPPKGPAARRRGIRGLMEAAEATGTVNERFATFIRHDLDDRQIDAAFRAVLRSCTHAMLQDDISRAKFGWSHCLTLPQAAGGLSSFGLHRKLGLATTLVWATAYRTILSRRALDFAYRPKPVDMGLEEALQEGPDAAASRFWHSTPAERDQVFRLLASEAAVRNDQHLVKYTRACFDLCGFDPTHAHLYLAAAAKLAAVWIAETPRSKLVERFENGRSTPS